MHPVCQQRGDGTLQAPEGIEYGKNRVGKSSRGERGLSSAQRFRHGIDSGAERNDQALSLL